MLTLKFTILIAFASFTGAHKIYFLSIDFLAKDPAYYASHFLKIIKTAMQSKLRLPIELTVFLKTLLQMSFNFIDLYLERTKFWRNNERQPLLSFIDPDKFVTT